MSVLAMQIWIPHERFSDPTLQNLDKRKLVATLGLATEGLGPSFVDRFQAVVTTWLRKHRPKGIAKLAAAFRAPSVDVELSPGMLEVSLSSQSEAQAKLQELIDELSALTAVTEVVLVAYETGKEGPMLEDARVSQGSSSYGELATEADRADGVHLPSATSQPDDDDDDDNDDDDDDADADAGGDVNDVKMLAYWRSCFDVTRPLPPFEDPSGMFSVITTEDRGMLTEQRINPPYLADIRVGYGLVSVDDMLSDQRSHDVAAALAAAFQSFFPTTCRLEWMNKEGQESQVDTVKAYGRRGYAFAIDREAMVCMTGSRFRNREYELLMALADTTRKLRLAPVIQYDRGSVYIVNLWEPGRDLAGVG